MKEKVKKTISKLDVLLFVAALISMGLMFYHMAVSGFRVINWSIIYMFPITVAFHFLQLYNAKLGFKVFVDFVFLVVYNIFFYNVEQYVNNSIAQMDYYVSNAIISNKNSILTTKSSSYYVEFVSNFNEEQYNGRVEISKTFFDKLCIGDTIIAKYIKDCNRDGIYNFHPNKFALERYQHPVLFANNEEFGNDYYYYAKLRPDLALKNFGLNILAIGKDNLLYYKNVNDSIDSQVHQCADSLQSQLNRDMLDTADAFYFHGEIIPAEKVFAEIPQTRAYYERYNKKQTHSTR